MNATPTPSRTARALHTWARLVLAHPRWVVAAFAALLGLSLWAAVSQLRISTDTTAMLADTLPWRQQQLRLDAAFPNRQADVLLLVDGVTAQQALDATRALDTALQASEVVADTFSTATSGYLQRNRLLFLSPAQLDRLVQRLIQAQPLLGRLRDDPSLSGFADTMTRLAERDTDDTGFNALLASLNQTAAELAQTEAQRGAARIDWQAQLSPDAVPSTRQLLQVTLVDDPGRAELRAVRAMLEAQQADWPEVRLRMTGALPLKLDELDAARDGAALAAGLSLLAVLVLLGIGLRSAGFVAASLLSLVVGLVLTAGFAALAVGRLNLISVAFSALYIGLAVDYAVHLCMHLRSNADQPSPIATTIADVGGSLLLCTLTTSVAFLAFLLTDYRGVAELGLIAGAGIVIGLFTSLTLLPALLQWWQVSLPPLRTPAAAPSASATRRSRRWVQVTALLLAVGAGVAALDLRFAYNPVHLKPAHLESVTSVEALARDGDAPLVAELLQPDRDRAHALASTLSADPAVRQVVWLVRFVPQQVDDKLLLIDDLLLSTGSVLSGRLTLAPVEVDRARQAVAALANALEARQDTAADGLRAWLAAPRSPADWAGLQQAWLGDLPGLLDDLGRALDPDGGTLDAIPEALQRRWLSAQGDWLLRVLPADDVYDDPTLRRFVSAVQDIAPEASGPAITYIEAGRSVQRAFVQAFGTALLTIAVLLVLLLRSVPDALRALAPLLLGSVVLLGLAALIPIPLNFANIIALPLLLGVAVDNGVHLIWRARQGVAAGALARSATGRAVLLSALTTLASFSALAVSTHRGMASMGQLLGLGLLIALLCTLVVLPALLPHQAAPRRSETA